AAVHRVLEAAVPGRPRPILLERPCTGDRRHRRRPALDGGPRRPVDDHLVRPRNPYRCRHRMAPQPRLRPRRPDLDLPLDGAVLLDGSARDRRALLRPRLVPCLARVRQDVDPGVERGIHPRRALPRHAPRAHDRDLVARRLDPRHAQHDGHGARRGLHHGRPGEGPAAPPRRSDLCRPQRHVAAAVELRSVARLHRERNDRHGARLLVPRHRKAAARRHECQGLPAHAGHLPRHHADGSRSEHPRRRRLCDPRSPRPTAGGMTMTTAILATQNERAPKRRPAWTKLASAFAMFRNGKSLTGLIILAIFTLMAIFAPLITRFDPLEKDYQSLKQAPSATHWLGTTHMGEDVFSQIVYGTRGVLIVGFLAGVIATIIAIVIGVLAGMVSGWKSESLSAITNVFLVVPG